MSDPIVRTNVMFPNPLLLRAHTDNEKRKPRYKVVRKQMGVSGRVYQITDRANVGQAFAVKQYFKNTNVNEIRREIQILTDIQKFCSKYFLCYVDSFVGNKYKVLVTEWLGAPYVELFQHTEQRHEKGGIPLQEAWFRTVCKNLIDGLNTLHNVCEIAHGDIKPENLFVNTSTGDVKYIDFGVGCAKQSALCLAKGTAAYMAPEYRRKTFQNTNFQEMVKTDYWSLGATIYFVETMGGTLAPERPLSPGVNEWFLTKYGVNINELTAFTPSKRKCVYYEQSER